LIHQQKNKSKIVTMKNIFHNTHRHADCNLIASELRFHCIGGFRPSITTIICFWKAFTVLNPPRAKGRWMMCALKNQMSRAINFCPFFEYTPKARIQFHLTHPKFFGWIVSCKCSTFPLMGTCFVCSPHVAFNQ
jgi:hypothetical protein